MHLDYWKLLRINGVQYTRKTKRIHWSTDLFDVADLEASFRFDADKCAAENKPSIVFTINSTTRLIQQLHPLSCKCRVEPDTDTLADVMLLEYWAEVVNVDRRYTSFSNESIRYSTWIISRTSSTDINCQVLQSTSTSIRKVINNTFTMMSSKKKLCTMSHAPLVSFNSTIPGVQSSLLVTSASDLPMRTIKFCFVLFGVTFRLSVINKIHWCVALRRLLIAGHGRRISAIAYTSPSKCWRHATVQQCWMPKPDIG